MKTLQIQTKSKDYPVFIGENVLGTLQTFVETHFQNAKVLIITDKNIEKLYLGQLKALFPSSFSYVVPAGEEVKTIDHYYQCQTYCLEVGLGRQDLIIAFGGGVVGDLAGFVAATFMRGIRFIQVPTTILAHDSAVGGKVAINHPLGKNMIGAFYQPEGIFYHLSFLQSLPVTEVRSGFAEVIKHALIADAGFYGQLRSSVQVIADVNGGLQDFLIKGIQIKATIVAEDEQEQGMRAVLNFGHTLGHALEKALQLAHGEAVAVGMLFALRLSLELEELDFAVEAFEKWMWQLGYFQVPFSSVNIEELLDYMSKDKKNRDGVVHFILLKSIGEPVKVSIEADFLKDKLEQFLLEMSKKVES